MNTYIRYFFKEFIRYCLVGLTIITAVSIIAEFFDKAPEFYREKPPISLIVQYLLLQSPRVILFALPFASLFSILITIGVASKWNEIVAIKASGNNIKKSFSSFLLLGIALTLIAFILGETVIPAATREAVNIRKVRILKRSPFVLHRKEALWVKGIDGSLIRIDGFVGDKNSILTTSIFSFNDSFQLEKRIEADRAEWADGKWHLKHATQFDFNTGKRTDSNSVISTSLEEPKVFKEEMKKPKEMSFIELRSYYKRLDNAGFKNIKYQVRLYEKLAYPTINFVMILFGVALGLQSRWAGGIRAAGLGVLITVAYWMLYAICISLGNTGILPAWLAPWISPVLFCSIGFFLYSRIEG